MSGRGLATPKLTGAGASGRRSPCMDGHSYKSEGAKDNSHTAISGVSSQGFRIGDRIFVGGTRPGTVCFIGRTKFADGEWAGINLDDATGKNDGAVGGARYFQCPMSHGLFSRMTNLSFERRVDPADAGSRPVQQQQQQKSASKGGSVSLAKAESQPGQTVTEASGSAPSNPPEPSAEDCPLKVGMRVIVGGTRPGTLRFVGTAGFAKGKGLFAGVELDEPTGKNDGSVEGERYFTCKPRYGLFAPVHRVLPLHADEAPGAGPASGIAAPSAASIGSGAGANRHRYGSQESVSSTGSVSRLQQQPRTRLGVTSLSNSHGAGAAAVAASSMTGSRHGSVSSPTETLKKVVQEKSEHIEQLLREREQERSEVARALGAAEEAEIARLKAERALSELRERLDSQESALATSERERDELRERLEDLQFSMAESMIGEEAETEAGGGADGGAAGDTTMVKSDAGASASELSSLLERVSSLETRLAEKDAEMVQVRAEADREREAAGDEAARQLATAEADAAERLNKMTKEAAETKAEMEKRLDEAGKAADEAKNREAELTRQLESLQASSTGVAAENERLTSDLMQAEASAVAARSETAAAVAQVEELRSRCSELQASLEQSRARINELMEAAASAPPPPPPPPPEQHQLQQQLEFLNSVIVDLKAKNTKLERDLHLLTALPDTLPDSQQPGGLQQPGFLAKPPRLYCDICEEFDVHDTEDCPVQGGGGSRSESPRPTTRRPADATGGNNGAGGSSRPYCQNCEIFGHNTDDCNQDETY